MWDSSVLEEATDRVIPIAQDYNKKRGLGQVDSAAKYVGDIRALLVE
jgi:hypothetical protein